LKVTEDKCGDLGNV